jgi:hypothetical protein
MVEMRKDVYSAGPLERIVVRQLCWWFGCAPHPQDPAPPDELTCMHCGMNVPYGDLVGDTRHNRTMDWLRYWMWRRWIPAKCPACGALSTWANFDNAETGRRTAENERRTNFNMKLTEMKNQIAMNERQAQATENSGKK